MLLKKVMGTVANLARRLFFAEEEAREISVMYGYWASALDSPAFQDQPCYFLDACC